MGDTLAAQSGKEESVKAGLDQWDRCRAQMISKPSPMETGGFAMPAGHASFIILIPYSYGRYTGGAGVVNRLFKLHRTKAFD